MSPNVISSATFPKSLESDPDSFYDMNLKCFKAVLTYFDTKTMLSMINNRHKLVGRGPNVI